MKFGMYSAESDDPILYSKLIYFITLIGISHLLIVIKVAIWFNYDFYMVSFVGFKGVTRQSIPQWKLKLNEGRNPSP